MNLIKVLFILSALMIQASFGVSIVLDGTKSIISGTDCSTATYRFGTTTSYNGDNLDVLLYVTDEDNDYLGGACVDTQDGVVSFHIRDRDYSNNVASMDLKFTVVKHNTFTPVNVDTLTVTNFDLDSNDNGDTETDDVYYKNPLETLISSDSDVLLQSGEFYDNEYDVKLRGKNNGNCNDSATLTELSCRAGAIWKNSSSIYARVQNDNAYGQYYNPYANNVHRLIQFSFEYEDIAPLISDNNTSKDCGTYSFSTNSDSWIEGATHSSYNNNLNIQKNISISNASQLKISFDGETEEDYDYLYIIDENGVEHEYSGNLNNQNDLIIDGSSVTLKFTSDGWAVDEGVTVTVESLGCNDEEEPELIAEYRFDECPLDLTEEIEDHTPYRHRHRVRNGFTTNGEVLQINRSGEFHREEKQYTEGEDGLDDIFGESSNEFTITTWVHPTSLANDKTNHNTANTIFAKASDSANDNIEIGINSDGTLHLYLDTKSKDRYADFGEAGDIDTNSWHFIGVSYKDGEVTVQIDDKTYTNNTTWSGATNIDNAVGSPVTIGASLHIDNYFDGYIDEFKIFRNRVTARVMNQFRERERNRRNWDDTEREAVVCEEPQEPFTCNETLYLSNRTELGTGSEDSGATWLHSFYATGATYAPIGDGFVSSDGGYNAIGYNVQDNFIYALYSNHLLKVDANAVVKDLGEVQGLPAEQLYAGEFDRDGYYYVSGNGSADNKMYKIDIEQKKVVATITLSQSVRFWDMAIDTSGDYFYTMLIQDVNGSYKNDKFAKIKISDGTITPIGSSHSDLPSYISLIFTDAEGKIIALSQDGKLYEIMPQSGKVYFTKPFAPLSFYNDGTSCPDANITLPPHPPRLSINNVSQLEGDSGETTFNFTVTADKPFSMMPMSGAMFYYRVVDANGTELSPDEVAIGGNICKEGDDTDFKKEEGIGMGMNIFGDGVSINLPVTICGDEKIEKDEKFFVEIYSPQLPPMMSPEYIIDKNIGIGTIINDDNIFNIERVNSNEESNKTLKESLYTQISGKDFDYSIVSYFGPDTNVEYDVQNVLFKIELLDSTDENKTTLYTKYYHVNELKKRFPIEDSDDLKIQRATRDAKFKIFYILDVNNTTISEFNNLQDAYENLENNSSFKKGINFSRDNFSIRPAGFKEMLWADDGITRDHLATSNQKESYGIALAAGYEYELQVKALSDNGDVLESYEIQNATQEVNATLVFDGNKTKCADITNRELHYYNFIGGVNSNKEFKNSNVGNYYITIKDENWTNIDHINQGCIVDSDSNEPDENGTIGCNIGSTFDIHSVDPTYNHYYDLKVYFQPYIFDIDLSIKNFSNSGHNYLYMADLNSSNKMSIVIDGNVTAMSKDNKIATNFTKSCLAQKVNLSLDYRITADSGVYDNNLTQLRTINNTPIVIQRRIKHNSKKFLDVEESAIFDNNITLSIEDFDDNLTGHSHLELLYNIKKNLNEEINPVEINFLKAHAISKDAGSNLATNEIEDFFPTGVENLGISRTLYYSRVSSLAKHYPATNKKSIYTPLFVEVYCRTNTTTQDWCRETMNLNDNAMINNGQKTYRGWYLATQHDSATEGRVLELQNITNNSDKITTNYTTSIPPFHNGKIDIQTIYVDGALTEKVSATIEIGTDPWLVFNEENSDKNASYSVTMKPIAGMTGVSPNKDTELGYNLMRDRNGTLNGIVEYNGKMSW